MKKLLIAAVAALALCGAAQKATAEEVPFLAGVWEGLQTAPVDTDVRGLALGLAWDRCDDLTGANLAFGGTLVDGSLRGVQFSIGINMCGAGSCGWQDACLNFASDDFCGLQTGLLNSNKELKGVQFGFVNISTDVTCGVQFGFLNMTDKMYGIQLGLINIISKSPYLPIFPFVNACF